MAFLNQAWSIPIWLLIWFFFTFQILGWWSRRKAPASVEDGVGTPCPSSPNCVSSMATDDAHRVEPLAYEGTADAAMDSLREVVEGMRRTRIRTNSSQALHAECRSLVFGFVDDLCAQADAQASVIHIRSSSRVGHSDLGANRARVERVRRAFEERQMQT